MRTPARPTWLLATAALLLAAACGEEAPPTPPEAGPPAVEAGGATPVTIVAGNEPDGPGAADTEDGTLPPDGPPIRPDPDMGKEQAADLRAEMNRKARALLASFESRVYSPVRNEALSHAEGHVTVRTGGVEARYAFTFDASAPLDKRTIVTRVDGEKAPRPILPSGTAKQVFELVQLSLNGAYRFVVNYLPPSNVLLTPGKDGKSRVVTAQPHRHEVLVSYNVDERDLVAVRGTSVRPQREIAYFAWAGWRGRHILDEVTFHGTDSVATYAYDETDGMVLLERVTIRKQGAGFDAAITYDRLDRSGLPEDPLQPREAVVPPPRPGDDGPADPDTPK